MNDQNSSKPGLITPLKDVAISSRDLPRTIQVQKGKAICNCQRQPEAAEANIMQPGLVRLSIEGEMSTQYSQMKCLNYLFLLRRPVVLKGCGSGQHSDLHTYTQRLRNLESTFCPKGIFKLKNIFSIHSATSVMVLLNDYAGTNK